MNNKNLKIGYLVIGRLKSTRLPKKLLLEIKGQPILGHMIDRLKLVKKIDDIVICTSTSEQDKPLAEFAKQKNVKSYAGHPDDVIARMLGAADEFGYDYILTITADCPLVDPVYADKIVEKYIETDADLIRQFDLPHGVFSYGIKVSALRKIMEIKNTDDTEVWGRYFTDTGLFNVLDFDVEPFHKRPGLRMTLDYPEDFEFFSVIFDELYDKNKIFSLDDILTLLDQKPEIININKACSQKFKKQFYAQSEAKLKKIRKVKKALIIGSGSIGQRHIRNLQKIGINSIVALRSNKGHYKKLPEELNVSEVSSWDEAIAFKADIAVVANPTSMHIDAALKIAPNVEGMFIEKPLSHSMDGVDNLITTLKTNNVVSFVGHNLIFHPIVKAIKRFSNENDVGSILNIQCQVGQWLPDWHPYEDYTKAYYANKELGGGVALTLIHEIHLALELAGLPQHVYGIISDSDSLKLDVDVQSDLMIKHKSGAVSQIHLDYLQKPAHRSGLITFEKGWVSYDFSQNKVVGQTQENDSPSVIWSESDYDPNLMYLEQIQQFIDFVEKGRVKHNFNADSSIESLKVVEALFESYETGCGVNISRNERFTF